ncbi:hypothetical protein CBM2637_A200505 [Cupriavidus taiwanensis]|nr:hypothetical protein CBM2637_A200505 [Cupriavidus taiwanensis]
MTTYTLTLLVTDYGVPLLHLLHGTQCVLKAMRLGPLFVRFDYIRRISRRSDVTFIRRLVEPPPLTPLSKLCHTGSVVFCCHFKPRFRFIFP